MKLARVLLIYLGYIWHIQLTTAFISAKFASTAHQIGKPHKLGDASTDSCKEKFQYDKPKVVFVLGGPGAGKGTQSSLVSSKYDILHLSAGDLLRDERSSGSEDGEIIDSYLKDGKILPVSITIGLIRKAMEKFSSNRYLIDGFPRNEENLQGWEELMRSVCDTEAILFLDCPEDELEKRLLIRGQSSGRSDDNIESIKKRFFTFKTSSLPVVSKIPSLYGLKKINGDQTIEKVFSDIKAEIDPLIASELLYHSQNIIDKISKNNEALELLLCPTSTSFTTFFNVNYEVTSSSTAS